MGIEKPTNHRARSGGTSARRAPGLGRAAWLALRDSSGCGIWVLDAEGRYHFLNAEIAAGMGRSREEVLGTRLSDHFPAEFVRERLAIIRKVLTTRQPVSYRTEFHGLPYIVHFRPIMEKGGAPPTMVLGVGHHPRPGVEPAGALIEPPRHADRGPLSALTDRELEVLRLIAEGLPYAEISARLNRTLKTIEAHRSSLGRKLGVRNRSQLVLIAVQNGLVPGPYVEHPVRPLPTEGRGGM